MWATGRRRLGGLLLSVSQQLGDDLVNDLIGQGADLVLGFGLDGVCDQDRLVVRQTQSGALGVGRADELGRGHVGGWNALLFKKNDIVRTARNTGPSIAEGFNNGVALLAEFGLQRLGRGAGDRRFHAAQDILDAVLLAQHFFHPVEEERAFGLADVKQAHSLAGQGLQSGGEGFALALYDIRRVK